jgi:hypothetical protein
LLPSYARPEHPDEHTDLAVDCAVGRTRGLPAEHILPDRPLIDRHQAPAAEEPVEVREPKVRLLEIPASSGLVVSAQVRGRFVVADPIRPRQDRLAAGCLSLSHAKYPFGLILVRRAGTLADRPAMNVILDPPDATGWLLVQRAHEPPFPQSALAWSSRRPTISVARSGGQGRDLPGVDQSIEVSPVEEELPELTPSGKWNRDALERAVGLEVSHCPGGDSQILGGLDQVEEPRGEGPRDWRALVRIVSVSAIQGGRVRSRVLDLSRTPRSAAKAGVDLRAHRSDQDQQPVRLLHQRGMRPRATVAGTSCVPAAPWCVTSSSNSLQKRRKRLAQSREQQPKLSDCSEAKRGGSLQIQAVAYGAGGLNERVQALDLKLLPENGSLRLSAREQLRTPAGLTVDDGPLPEPPTQVDSLGTRDPENKKTRLWGPLTVVSDALATEEYKSGIPGRLLEQQLPTGVLALT